MFVELERRLARPATERWVLIGLAALAFGLRLAHILALRESPLFDAPQMDALYHVDWARALAAGEEFQDGPYFRAPLYPWLLGAWFALFGDGLLGPRILGAGLGATSVVLTYMIGRRTVGRPAALGAALLLASHWTAIFYDGELLLEVLATPLYLGGLLVTLKVVQDGDDAAGKPAGVAGLLFGLGAICRPNVLLLLPPLFLGLWLWRKLPVRALASFGVGVLLPILPVTGINLTEGDRVLISYQAGVNFWIGNNPHADGSTAIAPGTRPDWWGGFEDTHAQANAAEGRELRPSEVSQHYFQRAREWIAAHPGRWLRLLAFKAQLFAMNWELGNNEEPRYLTERFSPLISRLPTRFGFLFGWAAAGLILALRKESPTGLEGVPRHGGSHAVLLAYGAALAISVVLFFVNARFRLPVLPILAIYASGGLLGTAALLKQRRFGPALSAAIFAVGLHFLSTALVPDIVPRNAASNGRLILAQEAMRADDPEHAQALLLEALERWPGNPVALEALASTGRLRFQSGAWAEAASAFRRVVELDPERFDEQFSLGRAELQLGNNAAALSAFELAVDASELEPPTPDQAAFVYEAYGRAVTLREAAGDGPGALQLAEAMVRRFPGDPTAHAVLKRLRGE